MRYTRLWFQSLRGGADGLAQREQRPGQPTDDRGCDALCHSSGPAHPSPRSRLAHGYLDLMKELNITCTHSRPRVSNDNAFSESQFKTQKYQPDYPGRFNSIAHARDWCEEYFGWYNVKHHHSGLAGFTPEQVFTGRYHEVAKRKQQALDARYAHNPERFVRGRPKVTMPPESVAINPILPNEEEIIIGDRVNFPTLSAAGYRKVC